MRWWLALTSIMMIGCSENGRSCGGKFLLLWPDARGDYSPTVVDTPTLTDSKSLDGPAVRVYFQALIADRGFGGRPAEPHVTNADGVCVPTDAGSSAAISAYAQFERLHAFDQRLGVADQLTWPRIVGVETKLSGSAADVLNNASYAGDLDLTTLVPSTWPGVPAGMNLGIVAHEHFHAHFQSQVMTKLPGHAAPTTADLFPTSFGLVDYGLNVVRLVNDTVLRGWNEGLADFYAAVYTGDPQFLRATFLTPSAVMRRTLDADLYPIGVVGLHAEAERMRYRGYRDRAAENLTATAYQQGTALARVLYRVTRGQLKESPEQVLTRLMKGLSALPERLKLNIDARELDYAAIVPVLLEGTEVDAAGCAVIGRAVGSDVLGRVSACASSN